VPLELRHASTSRANVELRSGVGIANQQKRFLSQDYLKKIVHAEKAWQERAKGIRDGDVKSVLDVLEERGFVNQIVG
jgi:hypothetical protein